MNINVRKKSLITADIKRFVVNVTLINNKYVIAEHIPIRIRYKWRSTVVVGNFKHYIGLDCLKRFARDLIEKETENKIKYKKNEANNTCHICDKLCIKKVRDHCLETGK